MTGPTAAGAEAAAQAAREGGCTVEQLCLANERACLLVGRPDLAATWHLVSTLAPPSVRRCAGGGTSLSGSPLSPWCENALGGRLVEQLIAQYLRVGDIQTVAVLTAVLEQAEREGDHHHQTEEDASRGAGSILPPAEPEHVLVHFQETEAFVPPVIPGADGNGQNDNASADPASRDNSTEPNAILHRHTPSPSRGPVMHPSPQSPRPVRSERLSFGGGSASAASASGSTMSLSSVLPLGHPAHLLPASADASSRTWGPGSRPQFRLGGAGSMHGPAPPPKSSYSSGTASPSDGHSHSIYNANAHQRLKWRSSDPYAHSGESTPRDGSSLRGRAGSMQHIARIEETAGAGGVGESAEIDPAQVPLPPYASSSHGQNSPRSVTPLSASTPSAVAVASPAGSLSPAGSKAQLAPSPPEKGALLSVVLSRSDLYRWLYAEYLWRIGCFAPRAQLLKSVARPQPQAQHALTGFDQSELRANAINVCKHCGRVQTASSSGDGAAALARCPGCLHWPSSCAVCELSVRGLLLSCLRCGHGGHPEHLGEWFAGDSGDAVTAAVPCPTGCGCRCVADGGLVLGANGDAAADDAQSRSSHRSHRRGKRHSRRAARPDELSDGGSGAESGTEAADRRERAAAARALADAEREQLQLAQQLAFSGAAGDEQADDQSQTFFYNPSQPAQ